MIEMDEELKKKNRNEVYDRMNVSRLAHKKTFGNEFKFIRGKGLVKRDEN